MRVQGSSEVAPIECVHPRKNRWRIRWDVRKEEDGSTTYEEAEFDHRPSDEEIRSTIIAAYNRQVDEAILSGFQWDGAHVWLTGENQFNYKAAFDLAVQTNGANLPVVFKFGTDEKPEYREFSTVEDLKAFYTAALSHVQKELTKGWEAKDAIDIERYHI